MNINKLNGIPQGLRTERRTDNVNVNIVNTRRIEPVIEVQGRSGGLRNQFGVLANASNSPRRIRPAYKYMRIIIRKKHQVKNYCSTTLKVGFIVMIPSSEMDLISGDRLSAFSVAWSHVAIPQLNMLLEK